jgi:hypothetical protein
MPVVIRHRLANDAQERRKGLEIATRSVRFCASYPPKSENALRTAITQESLAIHGFLALFGHSPSSEESEKNRPGSASSETPESLSQEHFPFDSA